MKSFNKHIISLALLAFSFGHAQEGFISTSRNMQFINPSFHGMNMVSKAGAYYSRGGFCVGTAYLEKKKHKCKF
jgi:hypothetical protein